MTVLRFIVLILGVLGIVLAFVRPEWAIAVLGVAVVLLTLPHLG